MTEEKQIEFAQRLAELNFDVTNDELEILDNDFLQEVQQ